MFTRIVKIAVLMAGLVGLAAASAYISLTLLIKSEDAVRVPALSGQDTVYALEITTGLGLHLKIEGSQYSPSVPKNHVLYQEPAVGTEIKPGRTIKVVISKGTRSLPMPNLIGLTARQARIILEENDLVPGKEAQVYDRRVAKDHLISQFPAPGILLKRGDAGDLLVSMGPRPVVYRMPDLIGEPVERAVDRIEQLHLTVGQTTFRRRKDWPTGAILSQDPASGHPVQQDRPIHLTVNQSPGRGASDLSRPRAVRFFRYRLANGYLKQRILILTDASGRAGVLFDDFLKPGDVIWLFVSEDPVDHLFIYADGELADTLDPASQLPLHGMARFEVRNPGG